MTTHNLKEAVNELNDLIIQFKFVEALDKFYDEQIITHENENPPISGLEAYRKNAKLFLENISNQSAELINVIISDDMSVAEWHYKFDHKLWGRWDCRQLSLQCWRNGKIVFERHHYNR